MIFITLIFPVKKPLLGFIILVKQYSQLANGYYKHRQAETINEDNTLCATGGKWQENANEWRSKTLNIYIAHVYIMYLSYLNINMKFMKL